ncbi:hypothetical protein NP493_348g00029 [Ridgeia piscesae]|uniref:Nipped-B protein n=1 Tax=Ridgeia piscesae TaxID=27915 RepID=A0AAD9L3A6_RIDPI|nr:hypothetical protein NP493_348g00029 [Ridgeia piscesae]
MREYEYKLGQDIRELYIDLLTRKEAPVKMRCQVLRKMLMYLMEEEARMIKADQEWKKLQNKEDLKEMGDIQSGMASTIIQVYIKQILESFFHHHSQVRMIALSVITLILRQGLVHLVQIVPYLISMGTDSDSTIRAKADQQVQELDKKYLGFIQVFFPGAADDDRAKLEGNDDEELNTLLERMPEDTTALPNLFKMSQGCILLLMLKQHLKELYRFTDNIDLSKIHCYSPTEQAKFKQLMLSIDPDDDADIPPTPSQSSLGTPAAPGTPSGGQAGGDAQGGPETGESQDSKPIAVIDLSGDGDGDNGGDTESTIVTDGIPQAFDEFTSSPWSHVKVILPQQLTSQTQEEETTTAL